MSLERQIHEECGVFGVIAPKAVDLPSWAAIVIMKNN